MTIVHVVVPDGIDDPTRPSGGNAYDRRICEGLAAIGWDVRVRAVPGPWPLLGHDGASALATALADVPDGGLLLVDGLIASGAGSVLVPEAARLRLVVLVHMPFGGIEVAATAEAAVLTRARAVVTTSTWTRDVLLARYPLRAELAHVARPGVDPSDASDLAAGTPHGGQLLCVAALVPHKGQDLLVEALCGIAHPPWTCTFVGSRDIDPAYVEDLRARAATGGILDRCSFPGPLTGEQLRRAYASADVLVLASRLEAYGMVVTEALAVGLPVIATDVGGVPEALGSTPAGLPGVLVPPEEPARLREALRDWLLDERHRARLRTAAQVRRSGLRGWDATARDVAAALACAQAETAPRDAYAGQSMSRLPADGAGVARATGTGAA